MAGVVFKQIIQNEVGKKLSKNSSNLLFLGYKTYAAKGIVVHILKLFV